MCDKFKEQSWVMDMAFTGMWGGGGNLRMWGGVNSRWKRRGQEVGYPRCPQQSNPVRMFQTVSKRQKITGSGRGGLDPESRANFS